MIILAITGYTILVLLEFIPLYRQKLRHDFWVNTAIGICSFTTAVVLSLDVKIPSPVKPIRELIVSIFGK